MTVLSLIFLDQICPKWIKLDQSGFLNNLEIFGWPIRKFFKRQMKAAKVSRLFYDQQYPNGIFNFGSLCFAGPHAVVIFTQKIWNV